MSRSPAILGGTPPFETELKLTRPTIDDRPAIRRRIEAILDSGVLTNGPTVRELEERAAGYLGVGHVVAVSSCTAGLMLVLQAAGARGGIVTPSFTFAATAHAVRWCGGSPVFADVDEETLTIDPDDAGARCERPGAVIGTHVFGTPCDVERLRQFADRVGAPLIYDAAHALGSRRKGRPIGGFGTAEVFSLSPTKVTIAVEGGLITTDDAALAAACRMGRDYGNPGDYDCRFAGLNARMSELHAAVGLASLAGVDERVARRSELAARLHASLDGMDGISWPHVAAEDTSTYKDLTIMIDHQTVALTASEFAAALQADAIETRRYYHPPVHLQVAYRDLPASVLPVTERAAAMTLTLPLWSTMTDDVMDRLADAVRSIAERASEVRAALSTPEGRRWWPRWLVDRAVVEGKQDHG